MPRRHALALALALLGAQPALAEEFSAPQRQEIVRILRDAMVRDPSILREAVAALQADDVRRQDQVTRDVIALLGPRLIDPADPVAGNPLGDATLVVFYDTRCPYCRRMSPVIASLLQGDRGLRVVWKDLPVLGPSSELESRFLLAAQKQGGYFKLQEAVLHVGGTSTRDSLRELGEQVGLDGGRLLRDVDDPAIKARLQGARELAQQLGIEGTPAFVVGGRMIAGAVELAALQQAVAEARRR